MLRAEELQAVRGGSVKPGFMSAAGSFFRSRHGLAVAVFVTSLLATTIFWRVIPASFRQNEGSDYIVYYEPLARSLVAGNGLTVEGVLTITHPPGYPLILAAVFYVSRVFAVNDETSLAIFSAVCMALVSVLIFYLARAMWGRGSAIIAAVLWLTYPFALWLTKQPNSEMPFMVVFYGFLLLFWHAVNRRINRWHIYAACGFAVGLAMLIRPFAIGLGLTMALVLWLVRRDLSKPARALLVGALLLGNVLAVAPWEIWAYSQTGEVIMLGRGGAGSMLDGLTFGVNTKNYREGNAYSSDVKEVMSDLQARVGSSNSARTIAVALVAETRLHPVATAKLFLLKAARSWYGTDSLRKEGWILLIQILYLLLLLWSMQRSWRMGPEARRFTGAVFVIVLYFWAMSMVGATLLRFTVPVTGLLFVLISGAFVRLKKDSKSLVRSAVI